VTYLTSYAWIPSLFGIGAFLDSITKPELRKGLVDLTFKNKTTKEMIISAHKILKVLYLPDRLGSFVGRSALITSIALIALTYAQYNKNIDAFKDDTAPFLLKLLSGDPLCVIFMIGIYFIDAISSYFTIVVIRVSRICNNIMEFMFLSISDVVMTFLIVIFILPAFLTFSVLREDKPNQPYNVILKSGTAKQDNLTSSLWANILIFNPMEKHKDQNAKKLELFPSWNLEHWSIILRDDLNTKRDIGAIYNSSENSDTIYFQSKGFLGRAEVFSYLLKALTAIDEITNVQQLETYEAPLEDFYGLIEYKSTYKPSINDFKQVYLQTIGDINFISNKIFDLIQLDEVNVSQNSVLWNYNLGRISNDDSYSIIVCDGSIIKEKNNMYTYTSIEKYENCKKAIAVRSIILSKLKQYTIYNFENNLQFPLSPFVLSSISTTIIIYYTIIVFILVNYLPIASAKFLDGDFLSKSIFSIYSIILITLVIPLSLFL
jgi:hypothetical protein